MDPLLPAARHPGLRRPHRAQRGHAAGPGRGAPLDHTRGIQRGPGARPARTRTARRPARHLPRMAARRRAWGHDRGHRLRDPVIPDGARARVVVPALRRAALDAGGVLRHRRRGYRDHRPRRDQARRAHGRSRPPACLGHAGQRGRGGLDRARAGVGVRAERARGAAVPPGSPICSCRDGGTARPAVGLVGHGAARCRRPGDPGTGVRLLRQSVAGGVRQRPRGNSVSAWWRGDFASDG